MRVTSLMIFDQLRMSFERNLGRIYKLNNQLSSGKRIEKPSDDVIGMMRAMDYKLSINYNDQFKRNIDEAKTFLSFTENVLSSVSDVLIRAKELALNGSTGALDAESRSSIAKEVANLRDHLLNLSNSKLRDRYVFSGFKTDTITFDSSTFTYQGDSGIINVIIDKSTLIPINVVGIDVFRYPLTTDDTVSLYNGKYIVYRQVGTNIDVEIYDSDDTLLENFSFSNFMEMLDHLNSALENNDVLKIQSLLKPLDLALNQVLNVRSDIGARLNHLDDQTNRLDDSTLDLKTFLSNTEDANIVEVISELSKAETALQALRQTSAQLLSQSLFNFLR
jgi:flagellar hook-associated protein 3 FlgL